MSWQSTRRTLRWTFASAVVILVVLQVSVSAQPEAESDEPLAAPGTLDVALRAEVDGDDATFTWDITGVDDEDIVTCTLDADGDSISDHSVEDCTAQTSLTHSYDGGGEYYATMIARSRSGRSGSATIRVEVE